MDFQQNREAEPKASEVEAANWLARQISPSFSQNDQQEFDAWYANSADNAAAYARVQHVWNASPALIGGLSQLDWTAEKKSSRQSRILRLTSKIAAALFLTALIPGMLAWLLLSETYNDNPLSKTAGAPQTQQVSTNVSREEQQRSDLADAKLAASEYSADGKTRSSIFLPDGSIVTLNRNSRIQVRYTDTARAITLVEGRARFQVAKHQKAPFYVYARKQRVIATGTAFDVALNNSAKSVEVALIEGSVTVDRPPFKKQAATIVANLTPGTQLVVKDGSPPLISPLHNYDTGDWRSNRLVFSNVPLKALVAELNRYGGPQIILGDEKLGALRIDGRLRTDDPVAVARGIAQIYSLHTSEVNGKDVRLDWK